MKNLLIITLLAAIFASGIGCTNMSKTQQGIASGAALGALGGAGVAARMSTRLFERISWLHSASFSK